MQQNRITSNVAIVWLIILVLVGYQGFALWASHRSYESMTGERARSLVRLVEGHASAKIDRANATLLEAIDYLQADDLVLGMRLSEGRRQRIQEMLVKRQSRTPGIVSMSLTDKDGLVFANSLGVKPGTSLASRKYFLDLKAQPQTQTQPVISEVIKGRVYNKWGIQVARRINLADGSFGGMLVANLGLPENFEEFYGTVGLEPDDIITLRDAENRVLVRHPVLEDILGKVITGSAGIQQVLLGVSESVVVSTSPIDGIVRFTAVRKLPDYSVFAIVGLGRDAAMAPWQREFLLALLFAAGALAAGGVLTFIMIRREQALRELEQHRHHLEALVEERTADLSLAKEVAETANRAKSTFLANMSHELRTPMNAIMGLTSLALRKATDPKLQDQLTKIEQASQHLLAVISDILVVSKVEAERLSLEQIIFQIGAVLENLVSLTGHKASGKNLKLQVDLPAEIAGLALRGDPQRLGQILLNFTGNAIKFTQQGSITLRVRLLEESATAVLLRFEVQDTGIGIAAEDQQRVFSAFEQADGSMTRKYGGAGLGLAISKRLAKLMDGEVGVESTAGQGSLFWFTARLGKASEAEPATGHPVLPAPTFTQDAVE
jgi:signal transduction histidine kinase